MALETFARDTYTDGEVLADQTGDGTAKTFTFASTMHLIWVLCDGGNGRADPFGGTPTASLGIKCLDGVPTPITIDASSIKIFSASGVTMTVWGFRYG